MTSPLTTSDLKKGLWTRDCKYKIVSLHWIGARRFWALYFDSIFRPKIKRPPSERDIFWSESLKARKLLQFSYPTDFFAKKFIKRPEFEFFLPQAKFWIGFFWTGGQSRCHRPEGSGFESKLNSSLFIFRLILSKETLIIKATIVVSE